MDESPLRPAAGLEVVRPFPTAAPAHGGRDLGAVALAVSRAIDAIKAGKQDDALEAVRDLNGFLEATCLFGKEHQGQEILKHTYWSSSEVNAMTESRRRGGVRFRSVYMLDAVLLADRVKVLDDLNAVLQEPLGLDMCQVQSSRVPILLLRVAAPHLRSLSMCLRTELVQHIMTQVTWLCLAQRSCCVAVSPVLFGMRHAPIIKLGH